MGTPRMLKLASIRKPLAIALLAGIVGGCSGADSGVEFNGKIFDVVGMNSVGKKSAEPRLAERAPLVPPPRTDALPTPGEAASPAHMAWPDDPDRKKKAVAANEQRDWSKYCADPMVGATDHAKATRDAKCMEKQGGVLGIASSWLNNKKDGASPLATEEGDPVATGSNKPQAATGKTR